jgi:acetyl esterase/lipase
MRFLPILLIALLFGCVSESMEAPESAAGPQQNISGPVEDTAPGQEQPPEANQTLRQVRKMEGIEYADVNGTALLLDLYLPEGEGLPLIIFVHGGGWVGGSRADCPTENYAAQGVAEQGFAVACIDYRHSIQAKFPAQIEDVKSAIAFLRQNAEEYGYDPNRMGIWGISAGGHLAALAGTSGEGDSSVQAVADWMGPTDLAALDTPGSQTDMNNPDLDYYAMNGKNAVNMLFGFPPSENPEEAQKANPITYASPDDPPFLIIHGSKDDVVMVNQSRALYDALKGQGVNATFIEVEGAGHGFALPGPELTRTMEFFRSALG